MFKGEGYTAYLVPVLATCFSVVKEKSNSQIGFFHGWIKLTVKEGEEVTSLNGTPTLPVICCYFVLLLFITENVIKLHASGLGGNSVFQSVVCKLLSN